MSDTVMVALISGAVTLITNIGFRWIDSKSGMKKDLADIKQDVAELKANDQKNGDMIYQMLDHLSTNNNTGEMKRALDQYNNYFRHSS